MRISRIIVAPMLAVGAAALAGGCASFKTASVPKEERVTVAQLSAPARATVEKLTAGGRVDKIDKEVERGKVVYDVEATVGGKPAGFLIADFDGEVLGTETGIEFGQLPAPVQAAAEEYFGTSKGLTAEKGVEYGETSYEVQGPKDGETVEVTFDPTGKRTREEKQ